MKYEFKPSGNKDFDKITTLVKPRFNGFYILLAFSTDKLNDKYN